MMNMRLLLVDDEVSFREPLAKRLAKRGFVPAQAANGDECLSLLAQNPVDVVILDVKMPGMNGIDVLKRIKTTYPRTEVILLTGQATTNDGVAGIKAGAFDYLTKPIELDHLINKIVQAYAQIQRAAAEQKEAEYRRRIEQQMVAAERLASLGTLAAGVAHEINNPLAIIQESAGWLKQLLNKDELRDMPRRADFEKALIKVEGSVERARRITHQLLGFVRKSDSTFSRVKVTELLSEAVQLIAHEAEKRGIKILWQVSPVPAAIWSDPYRLRQVFLNLLTNACQAIRSEGTITISLEDGGNEVAITVQDTGEGIPRENLDKIFEPFFSTKSPGTGTGLGLFVTRGILEKLGGTIEVESHIGQGASFCIKLPKEMKRSAGLNRSLPDEWTEKTGAQVSDEPNEEKTSS